ncbi:RlpA-like double-psi beta-barrel domain-containing protein [Streptomyces sp. YS-3]|uniref:RlpA-like double-psi beta-barrel domain-containing protein n=1 Tax=Streptomyces sp. YS-3 TaxID=3381352 RepID=UPI003862B1B1
MAQSREATTTTQAGRHIRHLLPAHGAPTSFQGTATWKNFDLDACGWASNDNEMVAAVSPAVFAGGGACGRTLAVVGSSGQSVKVQVVDQSMGGPGDNDLELSPAAFQAIGAPLEMKRASVTWSYSAG